MKKCQICSKKLIRGTYLCKDCSKTKHELKCSNCGDIRKVTGHHYRKVDIENNLCKTCKLKSQKGEKNPNYGNKWSDKKRRKQSELIKSKVDDEYRKNCSKGMKGKTWSDESKKKRINTLIERYGENWASDQMNMLHSSGEGVELRRKIGKKSKEKWTPEFTRKFKETMYENGIWIHPEEKDDYLFYREISNWESNMISESIDGYEKFIEFGLYDGKDADKMVRDHCYGRRLGFDNGVFPELLKHPANCRFISHRENISKARNGDDSSFTLDELLKRIEKWKYDFENQEKCLILVKQYRNGKRYNKKDYY